MPTTRSAKIAPIRAYWARFSGVESGLAPMSRSTNGRPARTIWTASAGRSTPGSRPIRRIAAAIAAPVWPAVMIASALPFRTRSQPTRIDESFFSRRASAGCSCISMTWLAGTISTFDGSVAGDRRDPRRIADEEDAVLGMRPGVIEGAGHDLGGPVVAAHRVDREANRRGSPLVVIPTRRRQSSRDQVEGASSFGALISRTGRPP